jgi:hypothetical protein
MNQNNKELFEDLEIAVAEAFLELTIYEKEIKESLA